MIIKRVLCIITLVGMISIFTGCFYISQKDEALIDAISAWNYERVVEAVENGADINYIKGFSERTNISMNDKNPASAAYFTGRTDIFKYLILKGADPNYTVNNSYSYLMEAVRKLDTDMCDFLLEQGADINFKSREFGTALDYLFVEKLPYNDKQCCIGMMEHLLSKGADISQNTLDSALRGYDNDGYCVYDVVQLVLRRLIESGKDSGLDESLEAAISGDTDKVAKNIKNFKNKDKDKILFFSVAFGSVDTVRLLIENTGIAKKDDYSNNMLMIAAAYNNTDMVDFFIQMDFDIEEHNKEGHTALTLALLNGKTDNADELLSAGAKYQWYGELPDPEAEYADLSDLLAAGTDILDLLSYNNQQYAIDFILHNNYPGDEININRALVTAIERGNNEIANYLFDYTVLPDLDSMFETACRFNNLDMVKELFAKGANVNGDDNAGTPLKFAIKERYFDIVDFLIQNGADVNAGYDKEKRYVRRNRPMLNEEFYGDLTPLNVAIQFGAFNIVKLLVEQGAVIDSDVIKFAKDMGSKKIIEYLQFKI